MSELTHNSIKTHHQDRHVDRSASDFPGSRSKGLRRENPYQSPLTNSQTDIIEEETEHSIAANMAFGLWAGALIGGTFGAGGAVILGVLSAGFVGWTSLELVSVEQFVVVEVIAAIVGAIPGLVSGLIIGPFVALILSLGNSRLRWPAMLVSVSASMLLGAYFGFKGGGVLNEESMVEVIGLVVGLVSGGLGGLSLGAHITKYSTSSETETTQSDSSPDSAPLTA